MAKEKRRHPRIRTDFGIQYKTKTDDGEFKKAVSVNISEGGLMMKLSETLTPDDHVLFKLILPPSQDILEVEGVIRYFLDNCWGDYPPFRCGIEFINLPEETRITIKKFVDQEILKLNWEHWI